jgi:uncharacterized membrane protein YdjX (TVP38/TMEM64 family)
MTGFAMVGFLLATGGAIAQDATTSVSVQGSIQAALEWVASLGAVGPLALIAIYVIATVVFISGGLLTLGAGALFGVGAGAVYAFIGASLGATAAFLVGRYLARDWVARKLDAYPKFQTIDQAVGKEGLKIVLLTRLSPVFPFVLLNYAFGITGVSLRDYVIGFVGMIPGTLLYTYLGSAVGSLAALFAQGDRPRSPAETALFIVGLITTVIVTSVVTRIARRALAQEVGDLDAQPRSDDPV